MRRRNYYSFVSFSEGAEASNEAKRNPRIAVEKAKLAGDEVEQEKAKAAFTHEKDKEADKRVKEAKVKQQKAIADSQRSEDAEQAMFFTDDEGEYDYEIDDIDDDEVLTESSIISEDFSYTNNLQPVFVVLTYTGTPFGKVIKAVQGGEYTHVAVGFDSKLEELYSFNIANNVNNNGGFSIESIKGYTKYNQDAKIVTFILFLKEADFSILKNRIKYYMDNIKSSSYNFKNIFNLLLQRANTKGIDLSMMCSQFADALFKLIDVDITSKHSSIVSPRDIQTSLTQNKKAYKIFEGNAIDYSPAKINRIIAGVKRNARPLKESFNFFDNGFRTSKWFRTK